jgi:spore maturation protein CgeB
MIQRQLRISLFGSSLVSAYWNGAVTYYRGIVKALYSIGYRVTFYEPDAYDRQNHRDIADPPWAEVVVYPAEHEDDVCAALDRAQRSEIIVKCSGVGVWDEFLEREIAALGSVNRRTIFWDVDAPATLDRVNNNPSDSFRSIISSFDMIFTYGGGSRVVDGYSALGAKMCVPIYNALDPETHYRVEASGRFSADLAFLGNRLPDREARVEEFFLQPAAQAKRKNFLLGGNGWEDKPLPSNVHYCGHVYTKDHNTFNSSSLAVLNVDRESMAAYGYSPPTRIFEAAGAGACIITDEWKGIEIFLEPGAEVLVASDGHRVLDIIETLATTNARKIGEAARKRILAQHTYSHRAGQIVSLLDDGEIGKDR